MPKFIKTTLRIILTLIVLVVLALAGIIIHAQVNEYKPEDSSLLSVQDTIHNHQYDRRHFTFVSWNIGYAGLGEKMDFFYDGGERVRPEEDEFKQYSNGIYKTIDSFKSVDFVLLQEVDINSKRSYYNNEVDHIKQTMTNHNSYFAHNYNVRFVPMPFNKPMGRVESGIQLLSKMNPALAEKTYFPSSYSWPYRLFMLDRVYIKTVFQLKDGKNLVVYNTHNSAFDNGELRDKEFRTIREDMLSEYARGNYVVAGGDWNQNPPEFLPSEAPKQYKFTEVIPRLKAEAMPQDWHWAWCRTTPTNRSNKKPFVKGENTTTIIDYYIVSPNLNVDTVITQDMEFKYSDHQPVYMRVSIPWSAEDSILLAE